MFKPLHYPRHSAVIGFQPRQVGDFSLCVRAYWPRVAITDGSWTPPSRQRIEKESRPRRLQLAHCALFPRRIIRLRLGVEPTSSRRHEWKLTDARERYHSSIIGQCAPGQAPLNSKPEFPPKRAETGARGQGTWFESDILRFPGLGPGSTRPAAPPGLT